MTDLRTLTYALADAFIDEHLQVTTGVLESAPVAELVELLQIQTTERGARILGRL